MCQSNKFPSHFFNGSSQRLHFFARWCSSSRRGSSHAWASLHECMRRKHHVQASLHRPPGSYTPHEQGKAISYNVSRQDKTAKKWSERPEGDEDWFWTNCKQRSLRDFLPLQEYIFFCPKMINPKNIPNSKATCAMDMKEHGNILHKLRSTPHFQWTKGKLHLPFFASVCILCLHCKDWQKSIISRHWKLAHAQDKSIGRWRCCSWLILFHIRRCLFLHDTSLLGNLSAESFLNEPRIQVGTVSTLEDGKVLMNSETFGALPGNLVYNMGTN